MADRVDRTERLLNLVIALMGTSRALPRQGIREHDRAWRALDVSTKLYACVAGALQQAACVLPGITVQYSVCLLCTLHPPFELRHVASYSYVCLVLMVL